MDCPECGKGKILVIKDVVCTCGHHPLVCSSCFTFFNVECGSPWDSSKLPPQFPMKKDDSMARAREHIQEMISEKRGKKAGEEAKARFRAELASNPTLEDFKEELAKKS